MAGRGRGFGGRGFTPKGDVPFPTLQPPPLYPPLQFKPATLLKGDDLDYVLTLKQEFRSTFKESGFYIPEVAVKNDIERYPDKYQIPASDQIKWNKSLFPKELFAQPKQRKVKVKKAPLPVNVVEKLKDLEVKEETEETEEKEEEEGEEEHKEECEDEVEEETDYAANYFDNGENYLDDEDDNLDDACDY